MTIAFDTIPDGILVPFWWAEIRPAQEPFQGDIRCLLIGNRKDGTALDDTPYILSDTSVEQLFGRASMVAQMYRHFRKVNPFGEVWAVSHTFDASGDAAVKAVAEIAIADPGHYSGSCTIAIGEEIIRIPVARDDTREDMAANLRDKIHKNSYCAFDADVLSDGHTLALTCKWEGVTGNRIAISTRWWGHDRDASKFLTITQPNAGANGRDVTDMLANLNDDLFDVICCGFSDSGPLNDIGDFLDGDTGRWSPFQQLYGHCVTASADTFANLVTLGDTFNDPHLSIFGFPASMSPEWCWAAEVAGHYVAHFGSPPEVSRPLQTLALEVSPTFKDQQWFNISERQSLYEHGIASFRIDQQRNVLIDREVTTYKLNAWGDPDPSWRDSNTLFQLMFFVRYVRGAITGAFPRAALTDVDSGIPGFASPGQIRDTIIHAYAALQRLGLVENLPAFAKALVVERDENDATRVNCYLPPDVVNQCRVIAALVESHLQLDDTQVIPGAG